MIKTILIIFLSLFVAVTVAEFAVRYFAPQELISVMVSFGEAPCHRLKSAKSGVQNSGEYSVDIATNSLGLREREFSIQKPENVTRILVLGDSHTFGWGVDFNGIFPKIIEKSLNSISKFSAYQVINCGMYGYATGHQYQYLQNFPYAWKPDIVIVAVDLLHDIKYNNEYFRIEETEVIRNSKPCYFQSTRTISHYVPFSSFLRGYSHLFRFAGVHALSILKVHSLFGVDHSEIACEPNFDLENTKKIFHILNSETTDRGIQLVVAILPEFNPFDYSILESLTHFLSSAQIHFFSLQEALKRKRRLV